MKYKRCCLDRVRRQETIATASELNEARLVVATERFGADSEEVALLRYIQENAAADGRLAIDLEEPDRAA